MLRTDNQIEAGDPRAAGASLIGKKKATTPTTMTRTRPVPTSATSSSLTYARGAQHGRTCTLVRA